LGYKAEHSVDLDNKFLLSARTYHDDRNVPDTPPETVDQIQHNTVNSGSNADLKEIMLDSHYYDLATQASLEFYEGLQT